MPCVCVDQIEGVAASLNNMPELPSVEIPELSAQVGAAVGGSVVSGLDGGALDLEMLAGMPVLLSDGLGGELGAGGSVDAGMNAAFGAGFGVGISGEATADLSMAITSLNVGFPALADAVAGASPQLPALRDLALQVSMLEQARSSMGVPSLPSGGSGTADLAMSGGVASTLEMLQSLPSGALAGAISCATLFGLSSQMGFAADLAFGSAGASAAISAKLASVAALVAGLPELSMDTQSLSASVETLAAIADIKAGLGVDLLAPDASIQLEMAMERVATLSAEMDMGAAMDGPDLSPLVALEPVTSALAAGMDLQTMAALDLSAATLGGFDMAKAVDLSLALSLINESRSATGIELAMPPGSCQMVCPCV